MAGSLCGSGERDGHSGEEGRLVQNRSFPDFRSPEVGISGIGVISWYLMYSLRCILENPCVKMAMEISAVPKLQRVTLH